MFYFDARWRCAPFGYFLCFTPPDAWCHMIHDRVVGHACGGGDVPADPHISWVCHGRWSPASIHWSQHSMIQQVPGSL
jgi:hypothetical protein